jgi:general secretion pathway protein G
MTMLSMTLTFAALAAPQDSRPATDSAPAAEVLFSGPQAGEKALPFKVLQVTGEAKAREFDPTAEAGDGPALYFFFQADVNRLIARSIQNVSAAGEQGVKSGLKCSFVGLTDNLLTADQRLRDVWLSLKPAFPALLSKDGIEGPGSWGLNKKCYFTVVLVKGGKVVYNLASLAGSEGEFEALRAEMSKMLGVKIDAKPAAAGRMGGRGEGGEMDERRPRSPGDAQRARVEADLKALDRAIQVYKSLNAGKPPSRLDILVEPDSNGQRILENQRTVPKDPWGHEYRYVVKSDGAGYELGSLGADGREGGQGRDADITLPASRPASRPSGGGR